MDFDVFPSNKFADSDKLEANLGYVYENLVAQMLRAAGNELYKYSQRIGERILLYTKDYCKDGQTTCVPVYFTPFL